MQRLVRGGATVPGTDGGTTAELLRKGLELAKASWAGLTAKAEAGATDGGVVG